MAGMALDLCCAPRFHPRRWRNAGGRGGGQGSCTIISLEWTQIICSSNDLGTLSLAKPFVSVQSFAVLPEPPHPQPIETGREGAIKAAPPPKFVGFPSFQFLTSRCFIKYLNGA